MAKYAALAMQDAQLDYLTANATELYFCNGQPADRAAAIATKSSAVIALAGGDFTKSNGAAGARVLTIAAKSNTVTVGQTTDHVALCSGTTLLYVAPAATAQNTNVGAAVGDSALTITAQRARLSRQTRI